MELLVVILCILIIGTFATSSDAKDREIDLFHGPESLVEKDAAFIYVRCQKHSEKFEKVCTVKRVSNIFNPDLTSFKICPAILESKRRNTVVGSKLKVIPFGYARTIVVWIEKYEGNETPLEVFVKITIVNLDNNCNRRDAEISLPLDESDNPDDSLDHVYIVTNDADDYFILTFYDEIRCGNKICKMNFDDEGNQINEAQPWFGLENGIIKKIVSLVPGYTEFGLLAFNDNPETYLTNESGSDIRKLDVYSDANSKIIYSTQNDSINLCYHAGASFSCGRFNNDGELKLKRRFTVDWDAVNGSLYYFPKFGLALITYSNSNSCKQTEIMEHINVISNDGFVQSAESKCRVKDLTVPQWIYDDSNQLCLLRYKITMEKGEQFIKQVRCFPNENFGNIHGIISKIQSTIAH